MLGRTRVRDRDRKRKIVLRGQERVGLLLLWLPARGLSTGRRVRVRVCGLARVGGRERERV